eukprot:TRINITY_DN3568_c0_g1_i2.p1 TRINITY_DN3568_c0_g1~~TRINITY_DN3568_c0_g1_i2.p1  ORF type:complete len:209 (-),score=50.33 TRINITY_DN3568_c0_g1_i2:283-819(-)
MIYSLLPFVYVVTTDELLELRGHFFKLAKKSEYKSEINRKQFDEALALVDIHVDNKAFLDRLFDVFDRENDGLVNFKEFVTGCSLLTRGTQEEKIAVCFEIYDLEHTGYITKKEMYQVLKAINSTLELVTEDGEQLSKSQIKEFVEEVFDASDATDNGKLSYDEFQTAVKEYPELVSF